VGAVGSSDGLIEGSESWVFVREGSNSNALNGLLRPIIVQQECLAYLDNLNREASLNSLFDAELPVLGISLWLLLGEGVGVVKPRATMGT
jgi:hypothetical protein